MLFLSAKIYSFYYFLRVYVIECNDKLHFMFLWFSLKKDKFSLTMYSYNNNDKDWLFDKIKIA